LIQAKCRVLFGKKITEGQARSGSRQFGWLCFCSVVLWVFSQQPNPGASAGHLRDFAGPYGIICWTLRDTCGARGAFGRSLMTNLCTIQKSGLLCGNWGAAPTITTSSPYPSVIF
jgi:hypothetical protein